jgi:hypothetical protein
MEERKQNPTDYSTIIDVEVPPLVKYLESRTPEH